MKAAASKEYFFESKNGLHRIAVPLFNLIPASGHELVHHLAILKNNEEILLIYPEGTRSHNETIGTFCYGIGKMHKDSGIPIIPTAIRGTSVLMPKGSKRVKGGTVELIIGTPVQCSGISAQEITEIVEFKVKELFTNTTAVSKQLKTNR